MSLAQIARSADEILIKIQTLEADSKTNPVPKADVD